MLIGDGKTVDDATSAGIYAGWLGLTLWVTSVVLWMPFDVSTCDRCVVRGSGAF